MDMLLRSPRRGNDAKPSRAASCPLPKVEGKFLSVDGRRFWAKGVTYGSFRANDDGEPFPPFAQLLDDFADARCGHQRRPHLFAPFGSHRGRGR